MATASAEPSVAWIPVIHQSAKMELGRVPPSETQELKSTVKQASKLQSPSDHRGCRKLKNTNRMFRVRAGKFRAICDHEAPNVRILLVDHRRRVYDKIPEAKERQKDQ